jgi:hypothetical protein
MPQDRSSLVGSVVAWVSAGFNIVKALFEGKAARQARAADEAAENEATWRITWGKPFSYTELTGYWLRNETDTRKYHVSVDTPAGTVRLDDIPARASKALGGQTEVEPKPLFKVSWHVVAKPQKRARPRTYDVSPS